MSNQRHPKVLQTGQGELLHVQGVAFMYKAENSGHGWQIRSHGSWCRRITGRLSIPTTGRTKRSTFLTANSSWNLRAKYSTLEKEPLPFCRKTCLTASRICPIGRGSCLVCTRRPASRNSGMQDQGIRGEIGCRILSAPEPLTRQPLAVHWLGL